MSDQVYATIMGRSPNEAQRMSQQFNLVTTALGHLLHPQVASRLPDSPAIADIATGTGRFLQEMAVLFPHARLDGYDISREMFQEVPQNVNLFIQDAKEQFPVDVHGIYDLIHVRYMVTAMDPNDWEIVLRNLLQILKPGGCIQWEEPDVSHENTYRRGLEDSRYDKALELSGMFRSDILTRRFAHGWNTLPGLMRRCDLQVYTDVVSSDRVVELRRAITENTLILVLNTAQRFAEQGQGTLTPEDVEKAREEIALEVGSEAYIRYDIWTAVGIKPMETDAERPWE